MTATPIPRTLAMSLYADLDLSVIDEPLGPDTYIDTRVLSSQKRDQVASRIVNLVAEGQAY